MSLRSGKSNVPLQKYQFDESGYSFSNFWNPMALQNCSALALCCALRSLSLSMTRFLVYMYPGSTAARRRRLSAAARERVCSRAFLTMALAMPRR